MTKTELEALCRGLAPPIHQRIKAAVIKSEEMLTTRLDDLARRLERLEEREKGQA